MIDVFFFVLFCCGFYVFLQNNLILQNSERAPSSDVRIRLEVLLLLLLTTIIITIVVAVVERHLL